MASNRIGRINEEIQRELSALIRTVKDPRVKGLISITAVDTTPDLKYAKVSISAMVQSEQEKKDMLKALRSASGFIRHALGQEVILRAIPELTFVFDDSIAYSVHISSLLREIATEEKKGGEEES